MSKIYYSVLTNYGATLFAQAMANRRPVAITHMAVGDGNGRTVQPNSTRTALFREVHRSTVSAVSTDPRNHKQVIFELTIPENIGGFTIREMGIFDSTGKMVAMANCPDTYKPRLNEGSSKIQVLRMVLLVSSSNAVTLSVDDGVIFATRGQLTPQNITATSKNSVDLTGHTHAIDHATTSQKGIVQLTDDTGLESSALALTAKAGKKLAQQIAENKLNADRNFIQNSKKSNAIDSNSADTVATSLAVKTLNERVNITKIPVKGANTAVTFNLTNKANWISEIGTVYRNGGHFQLTFHNNASQNISNLPLRDKSPVQLDVSVMGEFSKVQCHYLTLNRTFISRIDWNTSTFTLNWHEVVMKDQHGKIPREVVFSGSLEGNYRLVLRRNDPRNPPYFWVIDNGINVDEDITANRVINNIESRVGKTNTVDGTMKASLLTRLLTDKNVTQELTVTNSMGAYKRLFTGFSKTGNLAIGSGADNGVDRLQVFGTTSAHAPPDSANNNQVPNTFWVRRFVGIMVETAKRWIKEEYWVNKELNAENLNDVTKIGVYAQRANVRATAALNYPDAVAGTLFVTPSAYGIQQEYTTHTGKKYVRGKQYNADAPATWRPWQRVDSIDAVKRAGDTLTGALTAPSLKVHHIGGAYANQYNTEAPFYVNRDRASSTNTYYPFIKGAVRDVGRWGTAFSFGYTTKQGQGDGFGRGVIHLQEDNGTQKTWLFEHNGDFSAEGDVITRVNGRKLSETALLRDFNYQKIGNFDIRRYPDGTMIQTYVIYQNDLKDWREKSFNWANAFIDTPVIFSEVTTSVNGSHDAGVNVLTKSNRTTCYYWEYEHAGIIQGDVRIQFLAMGRWK